MTRGLRVAVLLSGFLVLAGTFTFCRAEERKVTKSELIGEWKHTPGDWKAFDLKADGSGRVYGGASGYGDWACIWDYSEHYQTVVFKTVQFTRQYRAKYENGKLMLVEGREVFRHGVSFNAPVQQPRNRAYLGSQ